MLIIKVLRDFSDYYILVVIMHKVLIAGLFMLMIGLVTVASGCTSPGSDISGVYKLKSVDVISDSNLTTVKLASTSFKVESPHKVNFDLKFRFDMKAMSLMNDVIKSVKITIKTTNPDFTITNIKTVNAEIIDKEPYENGFSTIVIAPKAGDEFEVRFTLNSKSQIAVNTNRGVVYAFTVRINTPMEEGKYTITLDYY